MDRVNHGGDPNKGWEVSFLTMYPPLLCPWFHLATLCVSVWVDDYDPGRERENEIDEAVSSKNAWMGSVRS